MSDYHLRPAGPDDGEALLALHRAAMEGYLARVQGPWDDQLQRERHRDWLAEGRTQVIEVGGEVAGLLDVEWGRDAVDVRRIELDLRFQGHGLGRAVMTDILAECRRRGLPAMLHVFPFNPARRLYGRLGFRQVGVDGPSLVMRWDPPPDPPDPPPDPPPDGSPVTFGTTAW